MSNFINPLTTIVYISKNKHHHNRSINLDMVATIEMIDTKKSGREFYSLIFCNKDNNVLEEWVFTTYECRDNVYKRISKGEYVQ